MNKNYHGIVQLAVVLGLSTVLVSVTWPPASRAAGDSKKESTELTQKKQQWQDRMSEVFRDAWKKIRGENKGSTATASLDLREDNNDYTVRLNLPNRDLSKVDVLLEGENLRIVAPAEEKASRYEQTVSLAEVDPTMKPKIERRQNDSMIVVTVPKSGTNKEIALNFPDPSLLPLGDWDYNIIKRMEEMRRDMDRAFSDAFQAQRDGSEGERSFNEPRFGSSVDIKEEADQYVIRAYLPGRDMQNIKVTVEGTTLKIHAEEQEAEKKEGAAGSLRSRQKAAYLQILTLPGAVQSEKMQVDKKDGVLVVTLPKSK